MKQIAYVDDMYVNQLNISHDGVDMDIFLINKRWQGFSEEWCEHLAWRDKTFSVTY